LLLQRLGPNVRKVSAPKIEGGRYIMRQSLMCETLNVLLSSFLITSFIFVPLFQDKSQAQSKDVTPPYISHHPAQIAILGKPINVVAHIYDESQIASVTIAITRDGQSVSGNLPIRQTLGPLPVLAKSMGEIPVFIKADSSSKVKCSLTLDETVEVTRVKGQYYRILTAMDVAGYVDANDCEVVVEGAMYGVAIPSAMTSASELSYQISATDIFGNVEKREVVNVRILDENDLVGLRSGTLTQLSPKKQNLKKGKTGGSMAKMIFITGVALASGGAYYMYSQNENSKEDESATLELNLSWE
jgi:hypothetical protein